MSDKWEIITGKPFDNSSWVSRKTRHWWVMLRNDKDEPYHRPVHVLAIYGEKYGLILGRAYDCGEYVARNDEPDGFIKTILVPKDRVWARMRSTLPDKPNVLMPSLETSPTTEQAGPARTDAAIPDPESLPAQGAGPVSAERKE